MALEGHRRTSDTVPTPRSPEDGLDHEEMEFTEGEGIGRGVLSRTLIQSPTIHGILPGKIRHKDQNDVIFVGERSIQILELQRTGYLEEVAMKTDFASNILAAKVIGSSEQEVEDFVDAVVKQEHSPSDEEMQSDSDSVELPPQLLALVLDSKEVLFLWARNTRYGSVDFQVSRRSLPVEIASLSRYGELLAVDGRSRALALGSSLGHFAVMSLKSTEHMKNDLYTNGHDGAVMPITEERFFRVDGHILQMDFLLPPADHPRSAILLLLVSKNSNTHILLYEWDTTLGLQHSSNLIGCSGQRLEAPDSVPLLLIPSTLSTSFMLVCEHGLASYSNVLGRTSYRKAVSLPRESPRNFKSSGSLPLWVQWARPQRHILRRGTHDDFYLCREDGLLHFVEIQKAFGEEDSIRVSLHFDTGSLRCNVDKAFAIMGGSLDEVADVLLAAGDMSDGGVYHCMPRGSPTCNQTIANWAPLTDMLVLQDSQTSASGRDRIFATCGRGEGYGAVTELRVGLEAKIGLIVEHDDAISMTGIWILPDLYRNRLVLLASHPLYSSSMVIDTSNFDIELVEEDALPGLDLTSPTITAGIVQESVFFQVTPSEIIACNISSDAIEACHCKVDGETIVFAAMTSHDWPTVVYISRDSTRAFSLYIRRFIQGSKKRIFPDAERTIRLEIDATSLCISPMSSGLLVCVGSADGKVSFFIYDQSTLSPMAQASLVPSSVISDIPPLDSLTTIRSPGSSMDSMVLVGGFRNGLMVTMCLQFAGSGPSLTFDLGRQRYHKLGATSIKITEDNSDLTGAYVNNGKSIMRIALLPGAANGQYSLDDVWFTDRNNPSLCNPVIQAMARVPELPQWSMQGLERALICSADDHLLFASCAARSQAVPRRLPLTGNPFRLTYLEHLQKFAVGVELTTVTRSRIRSTRPGIEIVDIEGDQKQDRTPSTPYLLGKVGERITCMTHWTPKAQEKQYGMIVFGTRLERSNPASCDGRLVFATADRADDGLKVRHKRTYRFAKRPVYSLASYGDSSLIVGLGQSLLLQSLDFTTRRWQRQTEHQLPSPAVQISVVESKIYVTTAKHSLLLFGIENNRFVHIATDKQSRNGVSHTVLSDGPVMVGSRLNGGTVTGFSDGSGKTLSTLFEACMPQNLTVTRKALGSTEPSKGQRFYASTIDGAVYEFMTLSNSQWRPLHFVQSLQRQNQGTLFQRFAAMNKLQSGHTTKVQPRDMHIDGDMLRLLVDQRPDHLRLMLESSSASSVSTYPGLSPEEKVQYLRDLLRPILGQSEDPTKSFVTWTRQLLGIEA